MTVARSDHSSAVGKGFDLLFQNRFYSLIPSIQILCVQLLSHVQLFCDPMDCSPPGSSVHGILQARILE